LTLVIINVDTQAKSPSLWVWDVSNSHSSFSKHVIALILEIRNPEQHILASTFVDSFVESFMWSTYSGSSQIAAGIK
jgi:hypothetical protein